MHHIDECPSKSSLGKVGIVCPFCKRWVFSPKAIEVENNPRLQWHCVYCEANFTSNPPFEEPGEDKESYKEKIIQKLLEEGNCESIVRIFATSSKKPPVFLEDELRNLLKSI